MATLPARPPFTPAETGYVSSGSRARGRSGATASRSTSRRYVTTRAISTFTLIVSSCSCGKISWNQPMLAATNRIPPSMLTELLLTNPAKSRVILKARTMGQAVGAGRWMVLCAASGVCDRDSAGLMRSQLSLAADNVNHSEHNHPNHIHEMPIERKNFRALAVLRFHFAKERENHGQGDRKQTHRDVKRMQPDKRVVRGAEKIRAHRQTFVVNQVMPLAARTDQKNRAESQGQEPPQSKRAHFHLPQRSHGQMDRQAARE